MQLSKSLAVALSVGTVVTLQGCGGGESGGNADNGGGSTASTPEPPEVTTEEPISTTTTTTTTTTTFPRTAPLSGKDAAAYLNTMYTGYNQSNESSPVGVVMRTANMWGFFCDGFEGYTGCFNGYGGCITSASILNNQLMIDDKGHIFMGLQRSTGIMFNTSLVETKLGRCTYQYDGTSWGRYNRGCGSVAPNGNGMCDDKSSAWWNYCDVNTERVCTDGDEQVSREYCAVREQAGTLPTRNTDNPCYWKGPAFDSKNGFGESETRKMIDQRIKNQGEFWDQMTTWDEVVIDAEILLEELKRDPAIAVPAIIWQRSWDKAKNSISMKTATKIAQDMQREFKMDAPVPVVGVDALLDVNAEGVEGPFFFEGGEEELSV